MVRWLRVLAALPEDTGLISRIHNGVSQPSPTLVLVNLTPSSGLPEYQAHVWYINVYTGKTLMNMK